MTNQKIFHGACLGCVRNRGERLCKECYHRGCIIFPRPSNRQTEFEFISEKIRTRQDALLYIKHPSSAVRDYCYQVIKGEIKK